MGFINEPISISFLVNGVRRSINDIIGYTTLREETNDILTVTRQPVQEGASITDHSYKEPFTLNIQILMQPSLVSNAGTFNSGVSDLSNFRSGGLRTLYEKFLNLQNNRQLFTVQTPKRTYSNVLLTAIGNTTDKTSENILMLNLAFQEVILVSTGVSAAIPPSRQIIPKDTQSKAKKSESIPIVSNFTGEVIGKDNVGHALP